MNPLDTESLIPTFHSALQKVFSRDISRNTDFFSRYPYNALLNLALFDYSPNFPYDRLLYPNITPDHYSFPNGCNLRISLFNDQMPVIAQGITKTLISNAPILIQALAHLSGVLRVNAIPNLEDMENNQIKQD